MFQKTAEKLEGDVITQEDIARCKNGLMVGDVFRYYNKVETFDNKNKRTVYKRIINRAAITGIYKYFVEFDNRKSYRWPEIIAYQRGKVKALGDDKFGR